MLPVQSQSGLNPAGWILCKTLPQSAGRSVIPVARSSSPLNVFVAANLGCASSSERSRGRQSGPDLRSRRHRYHRAIYCGRDGCSADARWRAQMAGPAVRPDVSASIAAVLVRQRDVAAQQPAEVQCTLRGDDGAEERAAVRPERRADGIGRRLGVGQAVWVWGRV